MPWNAAKSKVQLRLSIQRLRILQQKKEAQAKATRRDIATLLERGKIETARVKVEAIINEDIHVELLELLELYCELLLASKESSTRDPDPGICEGVCSIIHAAPRTELKELHILRDILMHKYGREFSLAVMENRDGCVSDRVVRKLDMSTPSAELVDAYLTEIAKAYSVEWTPIKRSGDDGPDGGVKESVTDAENSTSQLNEKESLNELAAKPTSSPPTAGSSQDTKNRKPSSRAASPSTPEPIIEDDFDTLAKRFAALKKR